MANDYFIGRVLDLIRENADEPTINAKYSDDDLIQRMENSINQILVDLNQTADNPLLVRHTITVSQGTDVFLLPPCVEQVWRIAELDENGDRHVVKAYEVRPVVGRVRPRIILEGRILRFEPRYTATDSVDLEILYVPNGDFRFHYGTADSATSSTLVLAATPTAGDLDTRENSYVGALVRIISDTNGYIQERPITAYDRTTRTATVSPDFDPTPTGTIEYEIVPPYSRSIEHLAALHVSRTLKAITGADKKHNLLLGEYKTALRAYRAQVSRYHSMEGEYFFNSYPEFNR